MKQIKLTEEGFDYCPACYILKEDEYDQIRLESSVMRTGSYLTISKAQAKRIVKFLTEFIGEEKGVKK